MKKLKFLSVIVATVKVAADVLEKIDPTLKTMETVFEKSGIFITAIGLSDTIKIS